MDNMVVATSKILISTGECFSLKEKRKIIKSIKEKIKDRFNLSVAEISLLSDYKQGLIGLAGVSNDIAYANGVLNKAIDFLEQSFPGRIIDYQLKIELY